MHRITVILLLCAETALAHPNHSGGGPLGADLLHLLTEPDHLAVVLLPFVVVAAIAAVRRRRRAPREKTARAPHRPGQR